MTTTYKSLESLSKMIENKCRAEHCSNKLSYAPQPENKYTQFCKECGRCSVCKNYLTSADIDYCEYWHVAPYSCSGCLTIEFKKEIETKKFNIEVTQQELDLLNVARLNGIESHTVNILQNMIIPNPDVDMTTNQYVAAVQAQSYWATLTIDQKLLTVAKMEAITATYAILLKREKQETLKTIKISMDEAAKQRFKEAVAKPAGPKTVPMVKCPKCDVKFLPNDFIVHKMNCTITNTARKHRNDREKAIDAAAKYYDTRGEAEAFVDEGYKKRGINIDEVTK